MTEKTSGVSTKQQLVFLRARGRSGRCTPADGAVVRQWRRGGDARAAVVAPRCDATRRTSSSSGTGCSCAAARRSAWQTTACWERRSARRPLRRQQARAPTALRPRPRDERAAARCRARAKRWERAWAVEGRRYPFVGWRTPKSAAGKKRARLGAGGHPALAPKPLPVPGGHQVVAPRSHSSVRALSRTRRASPLGLLLGAPVPPPRAPPLRAPAAAPRASSAAAGRLRA
jgi:hypothetical protein